MAQKKKKRVVHYGLTKISRDEKMCWLSGENKNGWSLGLALNNRTIWLRNIRFSSAKQIERALKSKVVFIQLKDSKEK